MNNKVIKFLIIFGILAANIGCDQVTKYYAQKKLKNSDAVYVLGTYVVLTYAENNGGFMGKLSKLPKPARLIFLIVFPILIIVALFLYIFKQKKLTTWQIIALSTLVAGGISNVTDRIINNEYVIDFMNIGIGKIRSGIFNFADLSILCGIALFLFIQYKKEKIKKTTSVET